MRVAVEGCAHGELEIIYDTIAEVEKVDGRKVDLLICCGDFQSTRNLSDLKCMAVPEKYKDMCTFHKYYSGEKLAPILTIFIGGNHEASNYLQELPYGGWVAPNIYYLGYASVVNVAGLRIAGISGIYKSQNLMQGHFEKPPYTDSTMRSVYHIRNLEIFRLKQLSDSIDIFLSHDWPRGVTKYGNENALLRNKPFFRNDIESNSLGSKPCMELLYHHYPAYWFSAHLHCKFAATVPEENGSRITKFLALDKCLPRRKFLQILEIEHNESLPIKLSYDLEWLTILFLTNHLLSVKSGLHYMPGPGGNGRWIYTPTDKEKETVFMKFNNDLEVPNNFTRTVEPYNPDSPYANVKQPDLQINPQTTQFCNTLGIDDPSLLLQMVNNTKEQKCGIKESITHIRDLTTTKDTKEDECEINKSITHIRDLSTTKDTEEHESEINESIVDSVDDVISEPGDISHISVEEDPSNVTSDSSSHTTNRLSQIALPSPRNNPDPYNWDEESPNKKSFKDIPDEGIIDTEAQVSSDNVSEKVETEPNCKKFKRRNHSMYSNTL